MLGYTRSTSLRKYCCEDVVRLKYESMSAWSAKLLGKQLSFTVNLKMCTLATAVIGMKSGGLRNII